MFHNLKLHKHIKLEEKNKLYAQFYMFKRMQKQSIKSMNLLFN